MIEPQVYNNGQRGVIGEQHGLTRLTTALETLEAGQRAQQTRDAQLLAQLTTLATTLTHLGRWVRWQSYGVGVLAVLTLGLSGLVGWQVMHPPQQQYVRALGAIDTTLTQTWGTLPKGMQEQVSATYARLGMPGPGERARAK